MSPDNAYKYGYGRTRAKSCTARHELGEKKAPTDPTLLRSSFALEKKGEEKKTRTAVKESEDEILISLIRLALLSHMKLPLFFFFFHPVYLEPNVSVLILHN